MNVIPINRARMSLAADAAGLSAYWCNKCDNHVSKKVEKTLLAEYVAECAGCGGVLFADDVPVKILPRYQNMLNAREIGRLTWWHATQSPGWVESLVEYHDSDRLAPYVHVGSKESACALAEMSDRRPNQVWYMNQIKLDVRRFKVSAKVFEDQNYWPEDHKDVEAFKDFSEITRYVNRYEIPGSVSLLVDYRSVKVEKVYRLTRAEIRRTLMR